MEHVHGHVRDSHQIVDRGVSNPWQRLCVFYRRQEVTSWPFRWAHHSLRTRSLKTPYGSNAVIAGAISRLQWESTHERRILQRLPVLYLYISKHPKLDQIGDDIVCD